MSENVIEIKDLVIEYHTDDAIIHAVNGVNLIVKQGETIGLVGETGAGKTTIAVQSCAYFKLPRLKYATVK